MLLARRAKTRSNRDPLELSFSYIFGDSPGAGQDVGLDTGCRVSHSVLQNHTDLPLTLAPGAPGRDIWGAKWIWGTKQIRCGQYADMRIFWRQYLWLSTQGNRRGASIGCARVPAPGALACPHGPLTRPLPPCLASYGSRTSH